MASNYPNALDSFETHADGVQEVIHAEDVNDIGQAVGAVQTVLGINPQGSELTVAARLAAKLDTATAQTTYAAKAGAVYTGAHDFTGATVTGVASGGGGSVGDATTAGKGVVQLAGHLAGTASSPQVVATALSAPLPLVQGGTGGGSAAAARTALGIGAAGTLSTAQVAADAALTNAFSGRLEQLKAWAVGVAFIFSSTPSVNSQGTITGGSITWPDSATGSYTAVSVDVNGYTTQFTATSTGGPLGTKTVTVTIPRDATTSVVNGAQTVTVS